VRFQTIIVLLVFLGITCYLSNLSRAMTGEVKKEQEHEEIVIAGPFLLGELYKEMEDKRLRGARIPLGGGPRNEHIIRALNKCKLYIIDKRKKAISSSKRIKYSLASFAPKLVLEGEFSFHLNDAKGKNFKIHVKETRFQGTGTWQQVDGSIPYRRSQIFVRLETTPYCDAATHGRQLVVYEHGFNFFSQTFYWDPDGTVLWKKPKISGKLCRKKK
jgi:hypothetical protein